MYYIHLYPHCYTLAQLCLPIGLQMERRPLKGTRSHPFDPKEIEEFEIEVVAYQSLRWWKKHPLVELFMRGDNQFIMLIVEYQWHFQYLPPQSMVTTRRSSPFQALVHHFVAAVTLEFPRHPFFEGQDGRMWKATRFGKRSLIHHGSATKGDPKGWLDDSHQREATSAKQLAELARQPLLCLRSELSC